MNLSIGIKALNEEIHIEKSIRSALISIEFLSGEVILADSGSSDKTIEIASAYPITIVQLKNANERSAGAGAQLAFQFSSGEYFYLLDGDMVLDPKFIVDAIAALEADAKLAGVGGQLKEMSSEQSFQILKNNIESGRDWQAGEVTSLNGGGLYRRSAIVDVGYFSDLNLHGFEEAELAVRLRHNGWKLARLSTHAVDHYGHTVGGYKLLLRRVFSGYAGGIGEVLRSALGQPHFVLMLLSLSHIVLSLGVILWWTLILAVLLVPLDISWKASTLVLLLLVPAIFLMWRRKSPKLGLYSFAAWNVVGFGLIQGLGRSRRDPRRAIAAKVVRLGGRRARSADPPRL